MLAAGPLHAQDALLRLRHPELPARPTDTPGTLEDTFAVGVASALLSRAKARTGAAGAVDAGALRVCAELLTMLRELVQRRIDLTEERAAIARGEEDRPHPWTAWARLEQPVAFWALLVDGRLLLDVTGELLEVARLKLVWLVQTVGLEQVRVCRAENCTRLFVKTYRREFCSTRCQDRDNKAKQRAAAAEDRREKALQHERARAKRRRVTRQRPIPKG